MKEFVAAIQGSATVAAGCLAAGWLLLRLLRLRLSTAERIGLSLPFGGLVCSVLFALLLAAGQLRRSVITVVCLLLAAAAVAFARRVESAKLDSSPWYWPALAAAASLVFGVVCFLNGAAPDITPPSTAVALDQAALAWLKFPLPPIADWSAATPLWGAAFAIGRHSAVSLLHVFFFYGFAALIYGAVRRWLGAAAATLAAILVITNPGLGAVAADTGTEILLLSTLGAACVIAGVAWQEDKRLLLLAALPMVAFTAHLARDPQASWFRGFLFDLIPGPWLVVPLLAVSCGWLFRGNTASVLLIIGFATLTSWPRITRMLAHTEKQIAATASPRVVFRSEPAHEYLARRLPGYVEARFLDEKTPAGAVILIEPRIARSWTSRQTIPGPAWQSMVRTTFEGDDMPDREERMRVEPVSRRSYALPNSVLVTEIRFYREGIELERSARWRVRCPEAFDNSPITGCKGPIEVDFAVDAVFDEVRILGKRGKPVRPPQGLREFMRIEWKRLGVTHILTAPQGDIEDEFLRNLPYWRLTEIGERNGSRLFRLD